jgi:hypothetical protein
MTDTVAREVDGSDGKDKPSVLGARWVALVLVVAALMCAGVVTAFALVDVGKTHHHSTTVPHSAAMEDQLGIRFSRVAVVGDGGLITVSYVVLDGDKASRFQSDVAHPPVLTSESRPQSTKRVSLMKQGHVMRPGTTYYLVYENTKGALRPGEYVTIGYGTLRLRHVPVL